MYSAESVVNYIPDLVSRLTCARQDGLACPVLSSGGSIQPSSD